MNILEALGNVNIIDDKPPKVDKSREGLKIGKDNDMSKEVKDKIKHE